MNLAFIGGGNMARAMLGGMHAAGIATASMQVLEPDSAKGNELARAFGVAAHATVGDWLRRAEVAVLAVKPQNAQDATTACAPFLQTAVVVSIVAGVRSRTLARWLGHRRIVRAMPNTPALIRAGITAVALPEVTADGRGLADGILRSIGNVLWLDEDMLDPVTAVSGSGPGYVFYFIEALQQAASEMGFTPPQARRLRSETFAGAAQLALRSDEPVEVLRRPRHLEGGTTAAALARLAQTDVSARSSRRSERRATAPPMGEQFDRASDALTPRPQLRRALTTLFQVVRKRARNSARPTQLLWRNAAKHPSRVRVRIRPW
jgi:pyrroline-5-carboxylate reductase